MLAGVRAGAKGPYMSVNKAKFRCEDSRMGQNGGHHAIRRRKLPQKSDLPDMFGDFPNLAAW